MNCPRRLAFLLGMFSRPLLTHTRFPHATGTGHRRVLPIVLLRRRRGVEQHTELEYETAFLGNRSLAWMRNATADKVPWLLYLAPHAPHGLALPAPWYAGLEVNTTAPRTPSWNYSAKDHHWLIAQQPPLTTGDVRGLDRVFQQR